MCFFGGEWGAQTKKQPPTLSTAMGLGCTASAQPSGPKSLGVQGQQNAPGWEQYVKLLTSPELEDSCSLRTFLAWR